MKRRWVRWVGLALVLVCSVLFVRQLTNLLSTGAVDLRASLPLFPAAVTAYMIAYLAFGCAWHQLLAAAGEKCSRAIALGIFTTSQFAKYLPGNVGHHAGRVVLSTRYVQLPSYTVIATMVVELAMVLGAMALLSLPSLGYWIARLEIDTRPLALAFGSIVAAGVIATLVGSRFRDHAFIQRVSHAFRQLLMDRANSSIHLLAAFLAIAVGVTLTTLSLGLLDKGYTLLSLSHIPALLGVFAASWLLGFLVPGAPAGIGIREVVLTEGLAPLIGREQAILIALLFRILSTVCDLLAFLLGSTLLWMHRKRSFGTAK